MQKIRIGFFCFFHKCEKNKIHLLEFNLRKNLNLIKIFIYLNIKPPLKTPSNLRYEQACFLHEHRRMSRVLKHKSE